MKMRSVMTHQFSQVPQADIQRSQFNRSHGYKTTFNSGYVVPIFVDEALPGDTFNLRASLFARLSTPLVPVMDNMYADTFYFAVPYRLVWDNWQKFNGEQTDPGDSTDYVLPIMNSDTGYLNGSLSDYFGLPTQVTNLTHQSLFHRAYNLIWNEWFRDQNLQDSALINRSDAQDFPVNYPLRRRGKRHDYFTSSLPWPQKGPAVTIPLGSTAPVYGPTLATSADAMLWQSRIVTPAGPATGIVGINSNATPGSRTLFAPDLSTSTSGGTGLTIATKAQYDVTNNKTAYADLTDATATTINALRQAFQIQKLYERDARGGTRYTEIIRAHFNVVSPDARLQRPEYLGGSSAPINISPIAQTSSTDSEPTPQGNLAAIGTMAKTGSGFVKSFTEHTLILGFINVRADLNYQQGLNRMWSRKTRWDFYWPALAHLGEQAVLNKEIYAQGATVGAGADENVFGYQERFAEYRYKPSVITGQFRSNYAQSLDIWHLAQDFANLPVLNDEFIQDNPPIARIQAVPSEPQFLLDCYFDLKCARPMPTYSVPGLIDHF